MDFRLVLSFERKEKKSFLEFCEIWCIGYFGGWTCSLLGYWRMVYRVKEEVKGGWDGCSGSIDT